MSIRKDVKLRIDERRGVGGVCWVSRASSQDIRSQPCLRMRLLIRVSWSESGGSDRRVQEQQR